MSTSTDEWPPCRSVENYQRLNFIEEGTYGLVFRAREVNTGVVYALKQVKLQKEKDGFPITSLREINTLFSVSHPNIVNLHEVVVGKKLNRIYLVMEYAEHDIFALFNERISPFRPAEIKALLQQLLRGVSHLHDNWIIHRDLKPSNLLLTSDSVLKICDFGLARFYSEPLGNYTQGVVTVWYRAPELLFASPLYSTAVDMWAVGCIFAELIINRPLFEGKSELDQMSKIADLLGAPSEANWPTFSKLPNAKRVGFRGKPSASCLRRFMNKHISSMVTEHVTTVALDLLEKMLCYDPAQRISAADALRHPYFDEGPSPENPQVPGPLASHEEEKKH